MVGCGGLTVMLVIVGALAVQNVGRNPDFQKAFGKAASIGPCSQNLVQIRDALKLYKHDHHNKYPADLTELTSRYLKNPNALGCGNSKETEEKMEYFRPDPDPDPESVVVRVKSIEINIAKQHQITYLAIRANGDIIQQQSAVQILIPANAKSADD